MKNLLIILFLPTFLFAQYQVGQTIIGSTGDNFGSVKGSISFNSDASIMAVGVKRSWPDTSYVRVLINVNNIWTQIGQDIYAESYEPIIKVSLSSDGYTVAIGAPYNNGINGVNSGHVRIYDYNGTSWNQVGQDIDGESANDESGMSVSLSNDGNTVAIGAPHNTGNGIHSGHARIFNWNGTSWIQMGQDIDGIGMFGNSISIDSSGTIVAIGGPQNHTGGPGQYCGNVSIFEFNGISWNQLGQTIFGEAAYDYSENVSLSDDGNIVAIGGYGNDHSGIEAGHVRIYNYNGTSWNQVGQDIEGESAGDESGYTVSMNSDGNIVAIGAPQNDGNGTNAGHVRVYVLNNSSWNQLGPDLDGFQSSSLGRSISLSDNGLTLSLGYFSGYVRVLRFDGCTDSSFVEYNPGAIIDDSSCVTPIVYGCTDPTAYTYNSSANTDDGSCCYTSFGSLQKGQTFYDTYLGEDENKRTSISYDGSRIAIGMMDSSEVIIMEWNGTNWQSFGSPIQFSNPKRVNISGNGNVVAIGNSSTFEIYEYSGSWNLMFSNSTVSIESQLALDYEGTSMVVGSNNEVKVFKKNSLGWDNDVILPFSGINPIGGIAVDIDSIGNRIVLGISDGNTSGPGDLKVYERISQNNWIAIGSNPMFSSGSIQSSTNNYSFGYDVSISADGNTVVGGGYGDYGMSAGSSTCGGSSYAGHAEIYEYDGNTYWNQVGSTICGNSPNEYMTHVSLSADGKKLVFSSYGGEIARYYENISGLWTHIWTGSGYARINGSGNSIITEVSGSFLGSVAGSASVIQLNLECSSGCTDPTALNYNPSAVINDTSCCYDCGLIEGFIYEDTNVSGSFDSIIETPLGSQIIQLEKSSGELSYLTSQSDGYYSFIVDTGQQVITYSPPPFWQSSNNNTQYAIDIQTDSIYSGLDFGIIPEFTKGDMTVDITTSQTVCNLTTTIWLTVRNEGTETITNVDLDLWVDPAYSVLNSDGGTQIGNHISWNLPGDFHPYIYSNVGGYTGQEETFSVTVQIPAGPQFSSFIDSVRVTPVQFNLIELDLDNNFDRADNSLLCSYDPNDKQVLPKKCFYNELDTLDFTIRFQNTGNYPATTVRLVDSLDLEKLDIMSFHVLGASHDYEWSLKVPSVLEVVFDNIMLVDSSVSFNESQGFFKYRIVVRDSLVDSQPSATPAFIYFDLNAPIVTNLPEVNFVSNLYASIQSTDISCNGANDGTATLNITSVTAPYTIAWNGGDTTSSLSNLAVGTYSVTLTDDKTCVYTESVSITEPNAIVSSNFQSICNGQSIIVGSNTYNTSGTYTDVLSAVNGCDSTITTNLTVLANTSSNTALSSCDPVSWNGQTYSNTGNYSFTTTNSNGCDSTATLDLTINSTTSSTSTETSCDSYSWNGNTYSSSGTYSWIGSNSNGCDSTATLDLTINSSTSSNTIETSCDNYSWNGNTYNSSGTYNWVGSNSNGCDSTATLNLTINNAFNITNTISICFGDSVTVGNNTYNQNGTYSNVLTSANGCDSTIITNLTVITQITSFIAQSGNNLLVNALGGNTPYSYQWNTSETTQTITPLTNGEYWVIITDMNSCESDTSFFTVEWVTTSIAENNINNLTVYPNPSNDIFNIEFNTNTKQDIDLRVHNVLGEVIFSESLKDFNGDYNKSIDLSQHPNAIYILKLNTKDGMINKKLILEN